MRIKTLVALYFWILEFDREFHDLFPCDGIRILDALICTCNVHRKYSTMKNEIAFHAVIRDSRGFMLSPLNNFLIIYFQHKR